MIHSSKNYIIVDVDDRPELDDQDQPECAIALGLSLAVPVVSGIVTHASLDTTYPQGTRVWFEADKELLMLVKGVKYSAVKTSAIIAYETK